MTLLVGVVGSVGGDPEGARGGREGERERETRPSASFQFTPHGRRVLSPFPPTSEGVGGESRLRRRGFKLPSYRELREMPKRN